MEAVAVFGTAELSTTRTVKLYSPAVVGVPLSTPAVFIVTPAGGAPDVMDQV
jgi:hypothetical protein